MLADAPPLLQGSVEDADNSQSKSVYIESKKKKTLNIKKIKTSQDEKDEETEDDR